jgi:hypothetical protein
LGDYREVGKEFGSSHKGSYLVYFVLLVVMSMAIDFIAGILLIPLGFVKPIILSLGADGETINSMIDVLKTVICTLIMVPMMGYSMDLVANTDEGALSRLGRNLKKLSINSVMASLSTGFITWMPILGVYVLLILAPLLKGLAFLSLFISLGIFIGIILSLYETVKRSILYMLVPYILALDPETKGYVARKLSMDLMVDYFNEAFMLSLKLLFIGLFSILLVVPLFWTIPYIFSTYTFFAFDRLSEGGFIDFDEEAEEESEE